MENKTNNKLSEKKPRIRKPVGDNEVFSYRNRVPILEIYYRGNDAVEVHTLFDKVDEIEVDAAIDHIAELTAMHIRNDHNGVVLGDMQELLSKTLAYLMCAWGDRQQVISGVERLAKLAKAAFEMRTNTKF